MGPNQLPSAPILTVFTPHSMPLYPTLSSGRCRVRLGLGVGVLRLQCPASCSRGLDQPNAQAPSERKTAEWPLTLFKRAGSRGIEDTKRCHPNITAACFGVLYVIPLYSHFNSILTMFVCFLCPLPVSCWRSLEERGKRCRKESAGMGGAGGGRVLPA